MKRRCWHQHPGAAGRGTPLVMEDKSSAVSEQLALNIQSPGLPHQASVQSPPREGNAHLCRGEGRPNPYLNPLSCLCLLSIRSNSSEASTIPLSVWLSCVERTSKAVGQVVSSSQEGASLHLHFAHLTPVPVGTEPGWSVYSITSRACR